MSSTRRPRLCLVATLLTVAVVAAGCGGASTNSSSTSGTLTQGGTSHLATAKFVVHAGLAFGAFHRYIYKPAKAGTFSGSPLNHKAALVKAGLAGLFVYHELKLAFGDAEQSPLLSKLAAPIAALAAKVHGLVGGLRSGSVNSATIDSLQGDVSSISSSASAAGANINEKAPSAFQLATGG